METVTMKRNGVYIIFPVRENFKEKVKKKRNEIPVKKEKQPTRSEVPILFCRPVKEHLSKRCIHCGSDVWRDDVNYCWECYKYENFESK